MCTLSIHKKEITYSKDYKLNYILTYDVESHNSQHRRTSELNSLEQKRLPKIEL